MTAGYSGTPLVRKLGIKAGHSVALLGAPPGFAYDDLPPRVDLHRDLRARGQRDVIHAFFPDARSLHRRLPTLVPRLATAGALWISWPKKASGVATDLSGAIVRQAGLDAGLVDVKVCAVDDTWSGHKFVRRLGDR